MLKIDDLRVSLEEEEKQIIKGLSLSINPGEVHAITVSYTHLTLPTNREV